MNGKMEKFAVNEKESEIIKWICKKLLEYEQNPPEFFIKQIMDT